VLEVRRLRILLEVARSGSLAAAASTLSYTPSAVSQQIATLEREAGTALLERRPRGVVLTEAGRTLVEHAQRVIAQLDAAEAALDDLANLRRGRLRMASFATAGSTVLPRAVDAFRSRHPDIELIVMPASPADAVAALRDGRLDVALTVDVGASPPDGVDVVALFEDPYRLALPRDHPRAGAPDLRLADLGDETWIDVPDTLSGGKALRAACRQAGFEPKVRFESDDYLAIRELVAAGAGLALLPELALHRPHVGVVLRDLGPGGPQRAVEAATRAAPFRSTAAEAMLAVLLELGRPRPEPQLAIAPPSR
jgi:DNA-binding transcriptional LysR family regulator